MILKIGWESSFIIGSFCFYEELNKELRNQNWGNVAHDEHWLKFSSNLLRIARWWIILSRWVHLRWIIAHAHSVHSLLLLLLLLLHSNRWSFLLHKKDNEHYDANQEGHTRQGPNNNTSNSATRQGRVDGWWGLTRTIIWAVIRGHFLSLLACNFVCYEWCLNAGSASTWTKTEAKNSQIEKILSQNESSRRSSFVYNNSIQSLLLYMTGIFCCSNGMTSLKYQSKSKTEMFNRMGSTWKS